MVILDGSNEMGSQGSPIIKFHVYSHNNGDCKFKFRINLKEITWDTFINNLFGSDTFEVHELPTIVLLADKDKVVLHPTNIVQLIRDSLEKSFQGCCVNLLIPDFETFYTTLYDNSSHVMSSDDDEILRKEAKFSDFTDLFSKRIDLPPMEDFVSTLSPPPHVFFSNDDTDVETARDEISDIPHLGELQVKRLNDRDVMNLLKDGASLILKTSDNNMVSVKFSNNQLPMFNETRCTYRNSDLAYEFNYLKVPVLIGEEIKFLFKRDAEFVQKISKTMETIEKNRREQICLEHIQRMKKLEELTKKMQSVEQFLSSIQVPSTTKNLTQKVTLTTPTGIFVPSVNLMPKINTPGPSVSLNTKPNTSETTYVTIESQNLTEEDVPTTRTELANGIGDSLTDDVPKQTIYYAGSEPNKIYYSDFDSGSDSDSDSLTNYSVEEQEAINECDEMQGVASFIENVVMNDDERDEGSEFEWLGDDGKPVNLDDDDSNDGLDPSVKKSPKQECSQPDESAAKENAPNGHDAELASDTSNRPVLHGFVEPSPKLAILLEKCDIDLVKTEPFDSSSENSNGIEVPSAATKTNEDSRKRQAPFSQDEPSTSSGVVTRKRIRTPRMLETKTSQCDTKTRTSSSSKDKVKVPPATADKEHPAVSSLQTASSAQFRCEVCGKQFKQRSRLYRHKVIHSDEKPFKCGSCSKRFKHKRHMRRHELSHDPEAKVECSTCGRKYTRKDLLRRHIMLWHRDNNESRFECKICDRHFNNPESKRKHELLHNSNVGFECATCGRKFTREYHLNQHIMRLHNDKRPRIKCGICGKSFKCESYKRQHESVHDPDARKLECAACGRKFRLKETLKHHIIALSH